MDKMSEDIITLAALKIDELDKQIAELQEEIKKRGSINLNLKCDISEQLAHIERLRNFIFEIRTNPHPDYLFKYIRARTAIMEETPKQSFALLQADAIERMANSLILVPPDGGGETHIAYIDIMNYIAQLKKEGKST